MLSTTAQYAIRALVELARSPEGERVLGRDLAVNAGLPSNYLSKVLVDLSHAGFVEACRGSHGGYRLGRRPGRLTLLEVVESFDGPQREFRCLLRPGHLCSATDPCSAHESWTRIREEFLDYLTDTSIGDLAAKPGDAGSAAGAPAAIDK